MKTQFGRFGGQFVPPVVVDALNDLETAFNEAIKDESFIKEYKYYLKNFVGRPSPIYYCENLTKKYAQEQAGKEQQQKFTEIFGSKKAPVTGQASTPYDMGRGVASPPTVAVEVGGRTRKNRRKIMPKRKSRRDKKIRRGRNKTKKIKIKKLLS
mgnify:CR=1 FL=1